MLACRDDILTEIEVVVFLDIYLILGIMFAVTYVLK